MGRLRDWVNERWPLRAVLRWGLEEEIPGGTTYAYVFGSSLIFIFAIQVITGIWQLLYYVPTTDHAYDSVIYLRTQVSFGWLIHGLHYWGANAFVVLISCHMARVFIWGAYKKPRELTWLLGSCLLVLVLSLTFIGAVLPWDELGYWAGEVGTSMAGTVPWVGGLLRRLARGGAEMGQLTLSRFFFLHVAVLPVLTAFFIVLHVIAFRQFKNVGPWNPEKRKRTGPFWPDQVLKDMVFASIVFLVLVGLAAFLPAPIKGAADPVDNTYQPKPEWCFLFLYQALKAFKGPYEPVGTLLLPLVLLLIVFLLPFYDRNEERSPARRPVAMSLAALLAVWVVAFTIWGYYSNPAGAVTAAAPAGDPASPSAAPSPESVGVGEKLFTSQGCIACHTVHGKGGSIGPDLSTEGDKGRSADWLADQIRDPKAHDPQTVMPAFKALSTEQVGDLVDFLMSLSPKAAPQAVAPSAASEQALVPAPTVPAPPAAAPPETPAGGEGLPGPAASIVGDPEHGAVLFAAYCQQCHGPDGTDKVPNPGSTDGTVPPLKGIEPELFDKDPDVFAGNVDRFLQHGSVPEGPSPALHMPDFGDSHALTQQQMSNLEAYVLSLNGVDRAQIRNAGLSPPVFFVLVAGVLVIVWVALGTWWLKLRRAAVPVGAGEGVPGGGGPSAAAFAVVVVLVVVVVGAALSLVFSPFLSLRPVPYVPVGGEAMPSGPPTGELRFGPPALDAAPADVRDAVKRGHDILTNTRDLLPQNVGNKLDCADCHSKAGMTQDSVCLVGVAAVYPRPDPRTSRPVTLTGKTNACFVANLNGEPLAEDSEAMLSILEYYRWISTGVPVGVDVPWLSLKPLTGVHKPDPAAGKALVASTCAACHGAEGQGASGPPLWGDGSFTDASSMAEVGTFAAFVRRFMPLGNPNLTDEQALDAAAFVTSRPRPQRSTPDAVGPEKVR